MASNKAEWKVIVELLEATDYREYNRISRKLLNLLYRRGAPEAGELIERLSTLALNTQIDEASGQNKPNAKADLNEIEKVFDLAYQIANNYIEDDIITELLMTWIREGRTRFLSLAAEKQGITLFEITENMNRFSRLPDSERTLSEAADVGICVALIRRFLNDTPQFINVAKNHIRLHDFENLLSRMIGPGAGTGKLGGKGSGLFLAKRIIDDAKEKYPILENVRVPRTWYLLSDGILDFLHYNALEEIINLKYRSLDEIRQEHPYFEQVFKQSQFSPEIIQGLSLALDNLGDRPVIVRSSSLLEDSFGAAFSGKYKSLFIANIGTKQQRMEALMDAVAEVYASTFSPDAIQYRVEKSLLDYQEEMGCLIQEVVGTKIGKYFLPSFAGVAFSNNEFRWSPRIKRGDGMIRLVAGLGTRAVDRVGDDYPMLLAPGQPNLRVNTDPAEVVKYSQHNIDVIDLETNQFKTLKVHQLLAEYGDDYPGITRLVSNYENGALLSPNPVTFDSKNPGVTFTFENLISRTPFVEQIKLILKILSDAMSTPVDIEFASDGTHLYILQCRPQAQSGGRDNIQIPEGILDENKIFSASKYVSGGVIDNIRYIVYVDDAEYESLETIDEMLDVGRIVSTLNAMLPKRTFILIGPGRWGSRGDIKLGVRVTYSDINKTAALVEVAKRKGSYTPEVSFGTHFFQDLVESDISYLPLYPDDRGNLFNDRFLKNSPSRLKDLVPWAGKYDRVVRIIDLLRVTQGKVGRIVMDASTDKALAYLVDYSGEIPRDELEAWPDRLFKLVYGEQLRKS